LSSSATPSRSVLTIGNFDGVHLGHQALTRAARIIADAASPRARVLALSFDPHPLTVLNPAYAPAPLTTFDHRADLLQAAGADEVVRLEPTPDLLNLSPEQFVERIVAVHHPIAIVEGPDFRFGKARAGGVHTLADLAPRHGFSVRILDTVEIALQDHTVAPVSSSLVRWLLSHGRITDAARALGRDYELLGTVVRGDRRGRELGFPTANLRTSQLLPADGVYAVWADLPDGRALPAALSVGTKPTFTDAPARTAEAFLFRDDVPRDPPHPPWSSLPSLPEYDWPLRLRLVAWIREQVRFPSVEALKDQMHRDCDRIRDTLTAHTEAP